MIKCGHCRAGHQTVAQVKACSQATRMTAEEFSEHVFDAQVQAYARQDGAEHVGWSRLAKDLGEDLVATVVAHAPAAGVVSEEPELRELVDRVRAELKRRVVEARYRQALETMLESAVVTRFGLVTALARLEAAPQTCVQEELKQGLYLRQGEIYRVKRGKPENGARLYAQHVQFGQKGTKPTLTYAPGELRQLRPEHQMSVDQINELAQATGWCGVCGRFLTHPKSVARGIGPVCWEKVRAGVA